MKRNEQFSTAKRIPPWRQAKLLDRQLASSIHACDDTGRVMDNECRRRICGWRGVAHVASQRSAILNLDTADEEGRIDETGISPANYRIFINTVARN